MLGYSANACFLPERAMVFKSACRALTGDGIIPRRLHPVSQWGGGRRPYHLQIWIAIKDSLTILALCCGISSIPTTTLCNVLTCMSCLRPRRRFFLYDLNLSTISCKNRMRPPCSVVRYVISIGRPTEPVLGAILGAVYICRPIIYQTSRA